MKFMFENVVKYSLQKACLIMVFFCTFVILGWAIFILTLYCIRTLGTHGFRVDKSCAGEFRTLLVLHNWDMTAFDWWLSSSPCLYSAQTSFQKKTLNGMNAFVQSQHDLAHSNRGVCFLPKLVTQGHENVFHPRLFSMGTDNYLDFSSQ